LREAVMAKRETNKIRKADTKNLKKVSGGVTEFPNDPKRDSRSK
jgi:hypothetical protein